MNCWEYNNCPPEIHRLCSAYPDYGNRCWMIAGTKNYDGSPQLQSMIEKIERCFACDYYVHHGHEQ